MRPWLFRGIILFVLVSIVVDAALISQSRAPSSASSGPELLQTTSPVIIHENSLPGTTDWQIPDPSVASTQIQAYASATSVTPGQALTFYVSTQTEGIRYSINIYRLGWYRGDGGRLLFSQPDLIGLAQGYYDDNKHLLVGCTSCRFDKKTGFVEADWRPSYLLTVPSNWVTGMYLAKFTDANGMQSYVPFDVRGRPDSLYIAVTSDTTYEAYNDWGGYSLYEYNSIQTSSLTRAAKVSFDRPYTSGRGSGDVLNFEIDTIHWLERQGYDLSYMSSVDLHTDPAQLLHHRAYISLGHDEYWTKEMRDGVEHARDQGVGLAFLEADAAYWQMRFEPDTAGTPNRTIVCYKVETDLHDLVRDPFYGKDNTRVTAQWRDPVLGRPENALIGIMYSSLIQSQRGYPWQVNPKAKSALLQGTGLEPGKLYGCGLVGYEWDRIFANGSTPKGLIVLGLSKTITDSHKSDTSDTTYYIAPSGAMVFATGSVYWSTALDNFRSDLDNACVNQSSIVPSMQVLMAHVMDALVVHHKPQF